ncbi:MAG: hypothetical protein NVSMB7_01860 [Chitinophagaceae bacterium]
MGTGAAAFTGSKMVVKSLTPSRIGIMAVTLWYTIVLSFCADTNEKNRVMQKSVELIFFIYSDIFGMGIKIRKFDVYVLVVGENTNNGEEKNKLSNIFLLPGGKQH